MLEDPGDTAGRSMPTSEIDIGIVFDQFTIPIDAFNNRPRGLAFLYVTGLIWPGTISDNKKLGGLCLGYLTKGALGQIRAIENDQSNGRLHRFYGSQELTRA